MGGRPLGIINLSKLAAYAGKEPGKLTEEAVLFSQNLQRFGSRLYARRNQCLCRSQQTVPVFLATLQLLQSLLENGQEEWSGRDNHAL